jgi:hypothetical protein
MDYSSYTQRDICIFLFREISRILTFLCWNRFLRVLRFPYSSKSACSLFRLSKLIVWPGKGNVNILDRFGSLLSIVPLG